MSAFLFVGQITLFADVSRILQRADDKLFSLGTWIKGVLLREIPYCFIGTVRLVAEKFFRIMPGIFDIRNPNCTGMSTDGTHL